MRYLLHPPASPKTLPLSQVGRIAPVHYDAPGAYPLDIEIMSLAQLRQRMSKQHLQSPHRLGFYLLLGITQGQMQHVLDFSPFTLHAGQWLLVQPGQVQRYVLSREGKEQALQIVFRAESVQSAAGATSSVLATLAEHQLLHGQISAQLDAQEHLLFQNTALQMSADAQLQQSHAKPAWGNALLAHQLMALLIRLASHARQSQAYCAPDQQREATGQRVAAQRSTQFVQLLERHFRQHHHLSFYCEQLACTDKTLSRSCLSARGMRAKSMVLERLMLEAKRELAHSQRSIQSIAHDLGFNDPAHFQKLFRQQVGSTPGRFRDQHRAT